MLVNWDCTFLGLYSYLIKLFTCLSDKTLSTILEFDYNSSIALLKEKPFDFRIKQE